MKAHKIEIKLTTDQTKQDSLKEGISKTGRRLLIFNINAIRL